MNKKKIMCAILCAFLCLGLHNSVVYGQDDSGKVDLYEAFSGKADNMKTEVGSRIFKWSIHLPDDGTIYKSQQLNAFNLSTSSYQSNIQLRVEKNKENTTLEEVLYKMENSHDKYSDEKEYAMNISSDEYGHRFIRVIKTNQMYDYYMVNEAAQESSDYTENRIYIANGYVYNLTVRMKGEFYKQHKEMFEKLVSSFKVSFDENNPYIKELSDSVSTAREYKNTSYGWKMTLSPYWRVDGVPNSRIQKFSPLYTDEQLNMDAGKNNKPDSEFKVPEGITVNLVSSASSGETSAKWAQREIDVMKSNYDSRIYEIMSSKEGFQGLSDAYDLVIRNKTVTNAPYITHNLYVVGNGYKYLVTATMKEEKYNDAKRKAEFENMMASFVLDKNLMSRYLGEIEDGNSVLNTRLSKELKMNKYDFAASVTKGWNILRNGNGDDAYNDSYIDDYMGPEVEYGTDLKGDTSNSEYVGAIDPISGMRVDMTAGLNSGEIDEIVKQDVKALSENDEVRLGLAKVKIKSAEYNGAQIYYIEKEYDPDAIFAFVKEDKTKKYDFESLKNQYEYVVKSGKDTFMQNITVSASNATKENKLKAEGIWESTSVNNKAYGEVNLSWKDHSIDEFSK